jgi:hypothetical protein
MTETSMAVPNGRLKSAGARCWSPQKTPRGTGATSWKPLAQSGYYYLGL